MSDQAWCEMRAAAYRPADLARVPFADRAIPVLKARGGDGTSHWEYPDDWHTRHLNIDAHGERAR